MTSRDFPPTSFSSEFNDHRLRRVDDDVLALEPRYHFLSILGGGCLFATLGGVVYVACWRFGAPATLSWLLTAIPLAGGLAWIVGLTLIHPFWTRAIFDRAQGTIALSGWRFQNRPKLAIRDLVAIQLCGPVEHSDWRSYQLNLVRKPSAVPSERINLLDNGDRAALSRMGAELAAFVQIPFIDETEAGSAPEG